ncbi:hypothetical protein DAPK24_025080 [Pichia kluyveri]|uniref:NADH dehydrogenase [ubiquinone] 1 alpha subcomplex assembly factor 3 n=1 Tax=Pichia kluyveri TaxID=36015 RepID=A0AAV5R317_PICKL|nr:hypothetical protein DAPK24_025080 [Pichia kluyveri]
MQRRLFSTSSRVWRHYTTTFKASNLGQNLAKYDIYALAEKPENNVEMVSNDSIVFSSLKVVKSPNNEGIPVCALLLSNQIFEVSLEGTEFHHKGVVVELPSTIMELFSIIYPKPELVVLGMGSKSRMIGPKTKTKFNELGIRVETGDTKSSALSYDLLATERSPALVSAIMLPPNI